MGNPKQIDMQFRGRFKETMELQMFPFGYYPNPKPQAPNSKPQAPSPKPQAPNPKPQPPTLDCQAFHITFEARVLKLGDHIVSFGNAGGLWFMVGGWRKEDYSSMILYFCNYDFCHGLRLALFPIHTVTLTLLK